MSIIKQSDIEEVNMFRAVVLFCAVLALTKGQITQVNQCTGSSAPLPLLTVVEGCRTPPCALTQGQDASISMVFEAPHAIKEMKTRAAAYLGFIAFPVDLGSDAETCNFISNTYCPVEEGEVIVYTLKTQIHTNMPAGSQIPIEIRIVDDKDVVVTCTRVPVAIRPAYGNQLE